MLNITKEEKQIVDYVVIGMSFEDAATLVFPEKKNVSDVEKRNTINEILKRPLVLQYYKQASGNEIDPVWLPTDSIENIKKLLNYSVYELEERKKRFDEKACEEKRPELVTSNLSKTIMSCVTELNKTFCPQDKLTSERSKSIALKTQKTLDLFDARIEQEKLKTEKTRLELDEKKGNLCYNDVAIQEFSNTLSLIHGDIKRLPETICNSCKFNPDQKQAIFDCVESVLNSLSNIEIELSSTKDVDEQTNFAHISKSEKRKQYTS